jgi:hypothetical protein
VRESPRERDRERDAIVFGTTGTVGFVVSESVRSFENFEMLLAENGRRLQGPHSAPNRATLKP